MAPRWGQGPAPWEGRPPPSPLGVAAGPGAGGKRGEPRQGGASLAAAAGLCRGAGSSLPGGSAISRLYESDTDARRRRSWATCAN